MLEDNIKRGREEKVTKELEVMQRLLASLQARYV